MPRKKIPALPLPTLRREEKKLQTRKQVLAAALGEFRDRGFDSASTSAIATLAGVSHGTIFTVEPTKEKLAAAAFDDEVRSIGERALASAFVELEKTHAVDAVMGLFTTLFDFYDRYQLIARVLLREMLLSAQPGGDTASDRLLNDYLAGLRVLLQAAIARGQLAPGTDAEALASVLLGVYLVFLLARLNGVHPDRNIHLGSCRRALEAVLVQHIGVKNGGGKG